MKMTSMAAKPFQFTLLDPTLAFVFVVALVPPLKARDPAVLLEFATDPFLWFVLVVTMVVIVVARLLPGAQARLEPWEHRAASWYLWNAAVFHLLLDFGVGNLKFLPTMQKNYQEMDTRYGCVPEHPCGGKLGVKQAAEPMVFILTWIEAVVDAPLCYLAFLAYLRGWAIRKPLELLIASSHVVGTILFMGTELYGGLQSTPPTPNNVGGPGGLLANAVGPTGGDPVRFEAQFAYFWFAFVAANTVWYIVPCRLAWIATADVMAALRRQEAASGDGAGKRRRKKEC